MPFLVLLLCLLVGLGVFISSFRLLFFALLALLVTACPKTMLTGIGAVLFWAIKTNIRR